MEAALTLIENDQRHPWTFVVYGKPEPGGSKRAVPGGDFPRVIDANKKAEPWKQEVRAQVGKQWRGELLRGPVALTLRFYRPRPRGHYGSGRNSTLVKASAPAYPITRPDVLKLARTVEDALTGLVWNDDAQIVVEHLEKHYGEPARVEIEVADLDSGRGSR